LTTALPRRTSLALLAGVAAPSLVIATPEVTLACTKTGKKCDKDKDCCENAKCKNKKCRCKTGFTKCDKKCFDLEQNESHCGECNNACRDGETCCTFFEGPGGFVTACHDLRTQTTACGTGCNNVVNCFNTDQVCVDGECVDP
jgi:hypothetical protein